MYNLFTQRFEGNNSQIKPPGFELVRRIYQREIDNIVSYYHDRVFAVKSNHLLCRVITTGMVPIGYDMERFMEAAYARSPYLSNHFNFTSEINYGNFEKGVFYGKGNDELLIYSEEYFDPIDGLENWKDLRPVKVLEHPISDFGLLLPNGLVHSTAKGLCVISINLVMLFVQYRGFVTEQMAKRGTVDASLLDTAHFVHMYVLPGMLQSHMEIAILNRFKNLFYGAPMSTATKHHPFPVVDYSDRTDKVLKEILKHVKDSKMSYYSALKNIPTIYSEDMQDALLMPDVAQTVQVWWALILTRLSTMKFLIDLQGTNGVHNNRSFVNKLKIEVKRLEKQPAMNTRLPDDLKDGVFEMVDEIIAV